MMIVASEGSGSHSLTLDNSNVKHAFGVSPDVKRRTLPMEESKSAIDSSSPRTPQAKADNDSIRRRLRESLTSALEMVVSKQVVKSVLGVAKDNDESGEEQKLVSACDEEASRCGNELGSNEPDAEQKAGIKVGTGQASMTEYSDQREEAREDNESPAKKLKAEREERGSSGVEKPKGGLQLMDRAKRVAWNVELSLFTFYNGGVHKKYKEKARSLLFNLKDKSNPELRERVFNGEITPEVLVRMTPEQLASKELSLWRSAKAEEFASMVVLTDADVDPRRIVKKTHKGEFRVTIEDIDNIGSVKKENEYRRGGESTGGAVGKGSVERKYSSASRKEDIGDLELETFGERMNSESTGKEAVPSEFGKDLPTVMSLDEFIHNRDDSVGERAKPSRAGDSLKDVATVMNGENLLRYSPSTLSDICTPKVSESPSIRNTDSGSLQGGHFSNTLETPVWEGSVRLSATRFAFIDGFYKSGERLELKDWPKSVEVKGRVRLAVLDKFLQDLQLSRSRTVTILSLCPADGRGDAKQTQAYLKEMADQYRMGDRAGFVEPRPGFELYLLAPGSNSLELLSEDLRRLKEHSQRDDEVLVGVVVWRKSQSKGLPSSTGSEQNTIVKKVALSNLASQSLHLNAKPVQWAGTSPVSQKPTSAPSLVNVSGNLSTRSSWSQIDLSATSDSAVRRDWQQPFAAAVGQPQASVPTRSTVTENVHDTVLDSRPQQQESVELSDGPPGFLPRTSQSFVQNRSMPPTMDAGAQVRSFPSLAGRIPGSMLGGGSRDASQDIPPGFLGRPSGKVPTLQDDDDDDLPEFNFEAERIVPETTASVLSPANQTQFLAVDKYNIVQHSYTGLQQMSAPGYRYPGFHNISHHGPHRDPVDLIPGHSELPTKHALQAEGPPSASTFSYIEGVGSCGDGQARGRGQPMSCEFPRSILPTEGPVHGNPQSRSLRVEAVVAPEEEFQETMGRAPSNFSPSQSPFLGDVNVHMPNTDTALWRPSPAPPTGWMQASPPTTFSSHHPSNANQHLSLARLIAQTQLAASKDNGMNWSRAPAPLPRQEVRHDHVQVLNMSNAPLWQSPSPVKMNNRVSTPTRKMDQRASANDKHRLPGNKHGGTHWRDHSHSREPSRHRGRSPSKDAAQGRHRSRSPSRERRQGSRSLSPSRDESRKDVGATGSEKTPTKPKRERERDQ